ncbi:MAG: CehA/McbA family metallohydrolase, partial [Acidobacteriota bacterium]
PQPDFAPYDGTQLHWMAGLPDRNWVMTRSGTTMAYLPEGRYVAIATRGPLEGLAAWEVPETGNVSHTFVLGPGVSLPSSVAVDFHVHSSGRVDSLVPLTERIWSLLAGGVQAFVGSDHGNITDYRPVVKALGVGALIRAIPGAEISIPRRSRSSMGHWNFWPLEPLVGALPEEPEGHGVLPARDVKDADEMLKERRVPALYDAYRRRARELAALAHRRPEVDRVVIELNHPRGVLGPRRKPIHVHAFFSRVRFDPTRPVAPGSQDFLLAATSQGTTALDFDTLEIWNRTSRDLYLQVRADWFALLNQGFVRTGVANTDTHTVAPELIGYPMNVVFLPKDAPSGPTVRPADLAAAVRAGRSIGTDGPVPLLAVTASSGETGHPGDLVSAPSGQVKVRVEVRAASWVPVGPIRLWINGRVAAEEEPETRAVAAGGRALRLDLQGDIGRQLAGLSGDPYSVVFTASLQLEGDAWILAEVGQPDDASFPGAGASIYRQVSPHGLALAFTNPVLVDTNGNGRFDPPGPTPAR